MIRKLLITLALLAMFLAAMLLMGQTFPRQTDVLDSTAILSQQRRWGILQATRSEEDVYRILLSDSSGILYVTAPAMEYYDADTTVATSTDDSCLVFDRDYEFFMIAAKGYFDYQVGFVDTADIYVPAGCVLNLYVIPTDTVWIQCAEAGQSTLISGVGMRRQRF